MSMKKRIEILEAKVQQEENQIKEIIEARGRIERENKLLKQHVRSLQNKMEKGKQEIINITKKIEQAREK